MREICQFDCKIRFSLYINEPSMIDKNLTTFYYLSA